MNGPSGDPRAQAARRATYRALALDPAYAMPPMRVCDVCDSTTPRNATRCVVCGAMPPLARPDQLDKVRAWAAEQGR